MWPLKTLPVFLINLPARVRLSIVVLAFLICLGIYWVILPLTQTGAILIIPVSLAAWMFGYRWTFVWMGITVLAAVGARSLILGTIYWPPSVLRMTLANALALLFIGLLISCLHHMVDEVVAAQLKTLQAEQAFEGQRQLNQLKDQFILNVNHEIRTPLTEVYGFLELLNDNYEQLDATRRARFCHKAMEGCEELILLVNNVLDSAHVSSDVKPPRLEELSVAQAVREVIENLEPRKEQEHSIHLDISEQLTIRADQQYLHQILLNLLSNAFKYSPTQTAVIINATLSESTIQGTDNPPQVCISVKDAGPGIPPAELPLLFGKFVRLKRDLSGPVRGSGLGLYISKQLVEAMSGHIWVESSGRAGEGSRFCFTLPSAAYPSLPTRINTLVSPSIHPSSKGNVTAQQGVPGDAVPWPKRDGKRAS